MDMTRSTLPLSAKLLNYYYAATIGFVLLDYLLNINVRVAFLQDWRPGGLFIMFSALLALG